MNNQQKKNISKYLSLVLRHQPDKIGITLDEHGWVAVDTLLQQFQAAGLRLDKDLLGIIVAENDKQRFRFNEDHTRIRASQGHSVTIDLQLPPQVPPDVLYHGTTDARLPAIRLHGLQKMARQHVHLSHEPDTATMVGSRHGAPLVLRINSKAMQQAGFLFYLSDNGVWLTDAVPVDFIQF